MPNDTTVPTAEQERAASEEDFVYASKILLGERPHPNPNTELGFLCAQRVSRVVRYLKAQAHLAQARTAFSEEVKRKAT